MNNDKAKKELPPVLEKARELLIVDPDEAERLSLIGLQESEERHSVLGQAKAYNLLSAICKERGDIQDGLDYNMKALALFEEAGEVRGQAIALNSIAGLYRHLRRYDESLDFSRQALKLYQEVKNERGVASCYGQIAAVYGYTGKYEKSIEMCMMAINIDRKLGNVRDVASHSANIGSSYSALNQNEEALPYLLEAVEILREYPDPGTQSHALTALSDCLLELKRFDETEAALDEVDELNEKYGMKVFLREAAEIRARLYEERGDLPKAIEAYKKYAETINTYHQNIHSEELVMLQTKFDVQQKMRETEMERLKNVELKKAYEDLAEAQDELIKKERMAAFGEIAQRIAHEVQNPLNFINNFSGTTLECYRNSRNTSISIRYRRKHRHFLRIWSASILLSLITVPKWRRWSRSFYGRHRMPSDSSCYLWKKCLMKRLQHLSLIVFSILVFSCQSTDNKVEENQNGQPNEKESAPAAPVSNEPSDEVSSWIGGMAKYEDDTGGVVDVTINDIAMYITDEGYLVVGKFKGVNEAGEKISIDKTDAMKLNGWTELETFENFMIGSGDYMTDVHHMTYAKMDVDEGLYNCVNSIESTEVLSGDSFKGEVEDKDGQWCMGIPYFYCDLRTSTCGYNIDSITNCVGGAFNCHCSSEAVPGNDCFTTVSNFCIRINCDLYCKHLRWGWCECAD